MLNALYPDIPWDQIVCVGFDLDGTLYDEFAFIQQVYHAILKADPRYITDFTQAYDHMLSLWLAKGSSYTALFAETCKQFGLDKEQQEHFVEQALDIYRRFQPQLTLPPRVRYLLKRIVSTYDTFLITDGRPALQRNKIMALGLDTLFAPHKTVITGELGADYAKPGTKAYSRLDLPYAPGQIVYFGDRPIDAAMCAGAGIHFQLVYTMIPC